MTTIIIFLFITASLAFSIYINARLFVYIKGLELLVEKQIEKNENMFQSMKEIVQNDFLMNDGRLKKFLYQRDNTFIYNGVDVREREVNI